jgi:hypothetical protein
MFAELVLPGIPALAALRVSRLARASRAARLIRMSRVTSLFRMARLLNLGRDLSLGAADAEDIAAAKQKSQAEEHAMKIVQALMHHLVSKRVVVRSRAFGLFLQSSHARLLFCVFLHSSVCCCVSW